MNPYLSFHGGAGTVTGSRFLVSMGKTRFLVDAGLFQGLKKLREMNWAKLRFDPASLDFVLLTHAHIDHAGFLPRLARESFRGPVHATRGTLDLSRLLLMDAAKIQEEDAEFANRHGYSKHRPALPLYTSEDAERALALFTPHDYEQWLEPAPGVRASFRNAGHILGAASVALRLSSGGGAVSIVFSGDVGRYGAPLHSDPDPLPECDVLVIEATYGDRNHDPKPMGDQIRDAVRSAIDRRGTVLIPSFAVGRAQLVTLLLRQLIRAGEIPEVPIHIDSPMAVDATRIYGKNLHDESLDPAADENGFGKLVPRNVKFHRTVEDSKSLNDLPGPRIIISASGMLTSGRVLHHLKRLLPDERNLVLLVGYQAAGTRGRAMMDGALTVRVHGEDVPVRARFIPVSGLSAHADRSELLSWVRTQKKLPRTVFVTHAEEDASRAFASLLREELGVRTVEPELGQSFDLTGELSRQSGL
jgi:metallo-beta-lactamase family protein